MKVRDFISSQALTRLNQAHLSLKLVSVSKTIDFAIETRKMVKLVIAAKKNCPRQSDKGQVEISHLTVILICASFVHRGEIEIFTVSLRFHRDFLITVLHSLWSIENFNFSFLLVLLIIKIIEKAF